MIRTAFFTLAALVVAGPVLAQAPQEAASTGPEKISCLVSRNIQQMQAGIDRKWYARTSGGKWWRNTMECPTLSPGRALVHSTPIGNQCAGDIVQVVDFMMGGLNFGGCALGDWERVDKPAPSREPRKQK